MRASAAVRYEGNSERKVSVAQSDVGNAVVIQDMEIKLARERDR